MTRGHDEAPDGQGGSGLSPDELSAGSENDRQRRDPGCHGWQRVSYLGKGAGHLAARMDAAAVRKNDLRESSVCGFQRCPCVISWVVPKMQHRTSGRIFVRNNKIVAENDTT